MGSGIVHTPVLPGIWQDRELSVSVAMVCVMSTAATHETGSRFGDARDLALLRRAQEIMTRIRREQAELLAVVAELDRANVAARSGYVRLSKFLSDQLRVTPREASKMVSNAAQVTETLTPTGHVTPAP